MSDYISRHTGQEVDDAVDRAQMAVTSISVNDGTPATPDEDGNVDIAVTDINISVENSNAADLEFADDNGNVVMRCVDGHVKTANFDSSDGVSSDLYYTKSQADGKFATKSDTYTKSQVNSLVAGGVVEPNKTALKILCLGNSFTTQTFSYLPFILKNYGINITIHILYAGGAGIDTYNSGWTSANKTMFSINTETDTEWATATNKAASTIVASKEWDIITLQQGSSKSYTSSNYSNLGALITKVRNAATNENVKIGWVINHIGPSSFTGGTDNRPNVLSCCESACDDNNIDLVFPYGTAIFNLMDKYASLGAGTYMTYEGLHLQEGFPLYAAAMSHLQALFDAYYPDLSVKGDIFVPDTTHRNNANDHVKGDLIGMSDWALMSRIAQFAAITANRDKFNINKII